MDLSERKKRILKAIISDYIKTAEPVGSKALSGRDDLNYSSATIRNEMSELEEMGYLQKTHTSSGRVPSHKGYRLYVDELMGMALLPQSDVEQINKIMQLKIKEFDKLLAEAGKIISNLVDYTTVALTPTMQLIIIKKFEIIMIDKKTFVIVVVLGTSVVKNKLVKTVSDVSKEESEVLTYVLNQTLTNIPIHSITPERFDIVKRAAGITALLAPIAEYLSELIEELCNRKLFLQGASKLLSYPEYSDTHKAQELLDFISDDSNFTSLAPYQTEMDGIKIAIGQENGIGPLSDASMIYASYNIADIGQGIIGIVGPTRMDYANISARLSLFAKGLNKLIEETFSGDVSDDIDDK